MAQNTEIDRKNLKRPDDFTAAVRSIFENFTKHSSAMLIAVGVLFVIGVGTAVFLRHLDTTGQKASDALFVARKALDTQLTAIAVASAPAPATETQKASKEAPKAEKPAPTPDSVAHKKLDVDKELADGVGKLRAVANDYSGTRAAFDARINLGDLYFDHGEAAKSIPWYQAAAEHAPSGFDKTMAYYALGYALEDTAKYPDALRAYERAVNQGDSGMKGDLLLAIGRCYEGMHDLAKAKSTYDQVISQFPETGYARVAETSKTRLE